MKDVTKSPKEILLKLLAVEQDIVKELIEKLKTCHKPYEITKVSNSIAYHHQCIMKLLEALKEEPASEDDLLTLLNKKMPKKYLHKLATFWNEEYGKKHKKLYR